MLLRTALAIGRLPETEDSGAAVTLDSGGLEFLVDTLATGDGVTWSKNLCLNMGIARVIEGRVSVPMHCPAGTLGGDGRDFGSGGDGECVGEEYCQSNQEMFHDEHVRSFLISRGLTRQFHNSVLRIRDSRNLLSGPVVRLGVVHQQEGMDGLYLFIS